MIRVNLWPAEMWLANIGHVSLSIGVGAKDEDYASWWPKAESAPDLLGILTYGGPAETVSAADDIKREGHGPKETFDIDFLDEAKIRRAWAYYKDRLRYAFAFENCATTVAHLLNAGGGSLSPVTGFIFATSFWWTPVEVGAYAKRIQEYRPEIEKAIAAAKAPSLAQTAMRASTNPSRAAFLQANTTVVSKMRTS